MSIVTPEGTFYTANNVHWIRLPDQQLTVQTDGGMPVKIVGFSWSTLSTYSNQKIIQTINEHDLFLSDRKISNLFHLTFSPKKAPDHSEEKKHPSTSQHELTNNSNGEELRFSSSSFPSSSSKIDLPQESPKQNQIEYPTTKIVSSLYQLAHSPLEKEALLCYLLHYQHYNADLTKSEMDQFDYPYPICGMQTKPGYTRTSSHLFHLVLPFIKKNLFGFFGEDPQKYVDLSSSIALDALSVFFPDQKPQMVPLTLKDLFSDARSILKNVSNENVIFTLQFPDIDCILLWGAILGSDGKWGWSRIDCLYGQEVISILGKVGATPDRLAANKFRAQDPEEVLEALNMTHQRSNLKSSTFDWYEKLEEIAKYSLDSSSKIYRDAILRWNECYFKKYSPDFALPLLSSEVIPWISQSGDLSQWIKGYQNLCEIIMLSLSASPEFCEKIDFESTYLRLLDPKNEFTNMSLSAGIFSYAMTSNFFILQHLLSTTSKKQPHVISVCQNYFETLQILSTVKGIQYASVESLDEIDLLPDILFVDIHPNNASKKTLFQNDVAHWIIDQFTKNPSHPLSLVLDLTLNHLSDPLVQKTVRDLKPLIENGKLEVFVLQSFAKLMQLGADNFSGGSCIYLGSPNSIGPKFPRPIPEKGAFFSLLCSEFGDLTHEYFNRIRENTKYVYKELQRILKGFTPIRVTFNGDENTVYIAINFDLILKVFSFETTILEEVKKILLETATARKVPLTGRQSFGFPISNLTIAATAIRFSIGIHEEAVLNQQVKIINDLGVILGNLLDVEDRDVERFLKDLRLGMSFRDELPVPLARLSDVSRNGKKDSCEQERPKVSMMGSIRGIKPRTNLSYESEQKVDFKLTNFEEKETLTKTKLEEEFIETINNIRKEKVSLGKLFVIMSQYGTAPIRISHLDSRRQIHVFARAKAYDFIVKRFDEENPDHLILEFTKRKPFLNYQDTIDDVWAKEEMKGVVDFLNSLDFNNLPLPENYEENPNDEHPLYSLLRSLGKKVTGSLDQKKIEYVIQIKDQDCKHILLNQIFESFFEEKIRDPKSVAAYAKIFLPLIPHFSDFDLVSLNKMIKSFKKAIDRKPNAIPEIYPYMKILIPSIKSYYPPGSLSSSKNIQELASLCEIGRKIKDYDSTLNQHMIELEDHLVKQEDNREQILWDLSFKYPLSQQTREILENKVGSANKDLIDEGLSGIEEAAFNFINM